MGFMVPVAEHFPAFESYCEETCRDCDAEGVPLSIDGTCAECFEPGWYGRLSAPGYLDVTDWSGPFASGDEALKYVMEQYEVDENGDELEDAS